MGVRDTCLCLPLMNLADLEAVAGYMRRTSAESCQTAEDFVLARDVSVHRVLLVYQLSA